MDLCCSSQQKSSISIDQIIDLPGKHPEVNVELEDRMNYLPEELLESIFNKLTLLSDHIRFGAVCKSWRSVLLQNKKHLSANITEQPPLLIISAPENSSSSHFASSKLYSIWEHKAYNYVFDMPCMIRYRLRLLGSSYGWLAMGIGESFSPLIIFNPFIRKPINLPRISSNRFDGNSLVYKVILSCDPSTSEDDLVVAAIYGSYKEKIAIVRPGQKSWTSVYVEQDYLENSFLDIIFHKGMLYAINESKHLFIIDYLRYNRSDDRFVAIVDVDLDYKGSCYLVEASNGDLLLLVKKTFYIMEITADCRIYNPKVEFFVYKMMKKKMASLNNKEVYFEEIHKLENNDTIFIGHKHLLCISSATSCPDCKPNAIYFIIPNSEIRPFINNPGYESDEIAVFDLDDGKVRQPDIVKVLKDHPVPTAWISPTLR